MRLQVPLLGHAGGQRIAVFGEAFGTASARSMADFIGREIIAAGCCLATDGRRGVAEACAAGALAECLLKGLDPCGHILSFVWGRSRPAFSYGGLVRIGRSKTKRRCAMVQSTHGALVIGGSRGVRDDMLIAVLEAIVEGYALFPVPGTGGWADRICETLRPFDDAVVNDPAPSREKARRLIAEMLQRPAWRGHLDPQVMHDRWFFHTPPDTLARAMFHIRRKYF